MENKSHVGLSENVGCIPNEIAIFHRDNDQQNHWVQWGLAYFQTKPCPKPPTRKKSGDVILPIRKKTIKTHTTQQQKHEEVVV